MNRFNKGFESQSQELSNVLLDVTGTIPEWLHGTLLRTGPAQFKVGEHSYQHWFDGLAMLRRFEFHGNQVTFSNKFIQSEPYKVDNETGKINFRGFAVDPCVTLFRQAMALFTPLAQSLNPVVNVAKIEDKIISMTEMPMALEIDPDTLEVIGEYPQKRSDAQTATAHPIYDDSQDTVYNFMLKFGARHFYRIYKQQATHQEVISEIPVKRPSYMHSFAMTENYIILVEYPFKTPFGNVMSMATVQRPFIESFEWYADEQTRFTVISKTTGDVVHRAYHQAFFAFHVINAYETDDNTLKIDLATYADASVIKDLYLDSLRGGKRTLIGGEFWRCTVPLDSDIATHDIIGNEQIELPRINDRYIGKAYRYAYGASFRKDTTDFIDQLAKFDTHTGETIVWYEDGCYPSEPIFVSAPDAIAEDDGVLVSVVLDSAKETSFMLVLDAKTLQELARAYVPIHLPFDFHGSFLR